MKLVLLLLAIAALFWLLRGSVRRHLPRKGPPPLGEPRPMIGCAHCGLVLPRDEALPGRGGVFCSEAHRTAYEAAHEAP
jgi:uncharacterized protein